MSEFDKLSQCLHYNVHIHMLFLMLFCFFFVSGSARIHEELKDFCPSCAILKKKLIKYKILGSFVLYACRFFLREGSININLAGGSLTRV